MKKQSQKNRPARGAKNTDRAAVILSLFREFPNNKFSLKHLASASGGATKEGRRETFEILGRLHDEGIVEECAREKYRLTHKHLPHFEGIADMTASGSVYVRVEGEENDIFVNQRNTANALNGDRVEVVAIHRGRVIGTGEKQSILGWLRALPLEKYTVLVCDFANWADTAPLPCLVLKK